MWDVQPYEEAVLKALEVRGKDLLSWDCRRGN